MDILQILLGQLPEAIYFALFMIFAKNIREKRILFTILMIVDYFLLKYSFKFSAYFHILYIITTFLTLKVLYKEKSQITDVFTFGIASLILTITSIPSYLLFKPNMVLVSIFNRLIIFSILFGFNYKLYNITNIYKNFWNRDDSKNKKIKSTTFRSLNLVVFNIMFYVIHVCMMYAIFLRK